MLNKLLQQAWLPLMAFVLCVSCNRSKPEVQRPSFKQVEGIKFIEVRREFDTGLSFNENGFQQVPEWTLYFLPGDSVKIYSPFEKRYIFYPIYFDHEQVINFAREWLRLIHVSKDSLVLQLLKVQSREVKKDLSKVYMRFYSEGYIQDVLKADADSLRRPNSRDTQFIRQLVTRANEHSLLSDSVFAARKPVVFKSKVEAIKVSKRTTPKDAIDYSAANDYLNPEYDIEISGAYKDFSNSFTVFVDATGKMTVGHFAVLEKEFEAPQRKVLQAITDLYLQRYLEIQPGSTLGILHATEVMLHVKGTKE